MPFLSIIENAALAYLGGVKVILVGDSNFGWDILEEV